MAHYGSLGDYRFSDTEEAASDIRGAKVYGPNNDLLGKIDDVIFDRGSGAIAYVVVDTGGWLSSNKFIVAPQEIRPSVQHEHDFLIDLTKEQIESLPAYDGKALTSQDKWEEYERWYRAKWEEDPILHRSGTDRNITPTAKPQGATSAAGTFSHDPRMVSSDKVGLPKDESVEEIDNQTEVTPLHPEVELDASPNMPSYRWNTFEDTLRRRREEVLQESIDSAKRADRENQSVPEQKRRKVS